MNDTVIKVIAILIVFIGLLGLWYFFRKLEQRNNVLTVEEATLKWKELKCVNFGQPYRRSPAVWLPLLEALSS